MKGIIPVCLGLCWLYTPAFSQEIARQQLVAEGGSLELGNLTITYTVGESFAGVGTLGGITLVQGFQQGFDQLATSLAKVSYESTLQVFPNPAVKGVHLTLETEQHIGLHLTLYTIDGKEVAAYHYPQRQSKHQIHLPVSKLTPGTYQLLIHDHSQQLIQAYTLQKR